MAYWARNALVARLLPVHFSPGAAQEAVLPHKSPGAWIKLWKIPHESPSKRLPLIKTIQKNTSPSQKLSRIKPWFFWRVSIKKRSKVFDLFWNLLKVVFGTTDSLWMAWAENCDSQGGQMSVMVLYYHAGKMWKKSHCTWHLVISWRLEPNASLPKYISEDREEHLPPQMIRYTWCLLFILAGFRRVHTNVGPTLAFQFSVCPSFYPDLFVHFESSVLLSCSALSLQCSNSSPPF